MSAAGGATHAGAHDLHRRHQRISEDHGPGERIPELRASLRVGRDPARIVIGRARNQSGAQDPEQPRLARSDHRAVCQVTGLFDFEGHACLSWAAASIRIYRGGRSRFQYLNCGIAFNWSLVAL